MSDEKVQVASSGTPQKEFKPTVVKAEVHAPAPKPRAQHPAANAMAIAPEKNHFHWYTPFGIARDFVKGTVNGMGDGLSKGARRGLKVGALIGVAMFFAPVVPFIASAGAAFGLPAIGVGSAGGLGVFVDIALYAIAGSVLGAAVNGVFGTLTGGGHELKLRGRREKYAEELAERNEIRAQARTQGVAGPSWQDKSTVRRNYDNYRQLRWFTLEHEKLPASQGGWADQIDAERAAGGNRGRH